jgi:hypothetical protein
MDLSTITSRIREAIKEISDTDSGVWHTVEQNICSHIVDRMRVRFADFDVDVELRKETGHRPDIVVHRRGVQDHNLVAIEVKKRPSAAEVNHDLEKISSIFFGEPYKYRFGLFISIGPLPAQLSPFDQSRIGIIEVDGWLIVPAT